MRIDLKEELMIAISIAVEAHRTQVDKIGMPYILHPLAVSDMFKLTELSERIVAVLHDVLEDTPVTVRDMLLRGISARLVAAVEDITKRDGEELSTYYRRVKMNPLALRVKFRDIEHNLSFRRVSCLPLRDQIRLKEKYRVAVDELRR